MQVVNEYFIEQSKPLILHPALPKNEIVKNDKRLSDMLIQLEQNNMKTENLTIFEFYNRIEVLEKKYKKHGSNK